MKTMKTMGYPIGESMSAVLAAVQTVYPQATEDSRVHVLGEYIGEYSDCAPYGVEGFHRDYTMYRGYWRIDGRLMEIRLRSGTIQDKARRRPFLEVIASAKAGRRWLNEQKAHSEQEVRERKAYGAAARVAARKSALPVTVVMAVGPENAEEFSSRISTMDALQTAVEHALGCGITRRKEAIFASLRISEDSSSPLAERIRHMGQEHSKRVANYIAELAPEAETALVYSCEAK